MTEGTRRSLAIVAIAVDRGLSQTFPDQYGSGVRRRCDLTLVVDWEFRTTSPATCSNRRPNRQPKKSDYPKSTTDTRLSVEDQVRKEWNPSKGGLPTFLA